ncbi:MULTISPECIES: hypothetical protein [Streptomyces]|uniref:Uncharacterized protein n=1 Tax=Streptomyces antibioticus TaxID=1890 RepID=A0AAE6Y6C1_STRAT|nr:MULTISPECIES: hypothetical protein [Streptomyces]MBO7938187.1 hypothetical protein [Streptomyces sp. S9]MCX4739359.1 hypothetical protein [Streptomyces antibioticus]MCX5168858.1 hypothetical protein [Streptomyces antibioticus]NUV61857.1 hypothetical protein [Streptomyces sp. CAI-85]OOQ51863.1 hypothetical protein AFM16_12825 [Streptomyces antibioticus]
MAGRFSFSPRRSAAAAAVTAMMVVAPVIAATDAHALGNNREVSRSCGTNRVSSGWTGSYNWALTVKASGDCAGRLSSALERNNGYWTPRVYGTSSRAYATDTTNPVADRYGLHWGCDSCNVTRS